MTLTRSRSVKSLATLLNTATATYERIPLESSGNFSTPIFSIGSGNGQEGNGQPGINYGEWTLTPSRTFEAEVKMWGAGGGSHNNTSGSGAAGGGGYAKSQITFLKDIPYVIFVGQGGSYAYHNQDSNGNRTNAWESGGFGGGGGGGHNAGGGGGMSAIFFNTYGAEGPSGQWWNSTETTFRGPAQSNAILVAGGGGGAGHHDTANHGQGGGGGGSVANHGHAQSQATQIDAGHAWRDGNYGSGGYRMQGGHGGAQSYTGGGGGGYWGGPGGTYRASGGHHNGGGGGSGHALDLGSTPEHWNYWIREKYPTLVRGSYLETAPGVHQNHNRLPAASGDSDWDGAGYAAGSGQYSTNHGGRNGKVIIRMLG